MVVERLALNCDGKPGYYNRIVEIAKKNQTMIRMFVTQTIYTTKYYVVQINANSATSTSYPIFGEEIENTD